MESIQTDDQNTNPAPQRRWVLAAGIGLVLLLAAAAFVGGRLLNKPQEQAAGYNGMRIITSSSGGGAAPTTKEITFEAAQELPDSTPDLVGVFVRREDRSVFVGTGNVTMGMSISDGGEMETSANYDGPVLQVVTTRDTLIYQDATDMQFDNPPADGKIQQVVKPGSLDDMAKNNLVTVWGERQGDRVIARILVFQ